MAGGTDPGGARPPDRTARTPGLSFAVLGPVRAWRDGAQLPAGPPQQRALLAALLLRGGRTATAGELLDAVWGEERPATALAALRGYAFRLRKALGAEALTTVDGGYALRQGSFTLDLAEAEEQAAEAERARAAGEAGRARTLLAAALDRFDGEPLAGLPGPYAEGQRARLLEWRLRLMERRLALDLELGGHAETVSELTALSTEHPLREELRALLMLALYRSGRQAEALAVFADTRRLLAEELGVDPGAELATLHQRILRADPGLTPPPRAEPEGQPGPSGAGEPPAERPRPAQLPATVADFTGREAVVRELAESLATPGEGVMALSAVAGIGGVGKTTLAVHVAHRAAAAFPDGQLYVDLQGTAARPAEPDAVLAGFLRALGVPEPGIPESLPERAALFRTQVSGRRVLALLDNAHDAAQVRPLLPGTPGSAALITSRARMVGLEGARLVDLDVMSPEEALRLFTRIVGAERVAGERQAALDVVAACGFLPLAIRIAASRLATRRTWTVAFLARKLSDSRRRLDELRAGDLAVKATFELGYGQLTPEQARAFRLLALPEGPDISLDAAAAVLDLDPMDAEDLIEALVDISLIESAAPARYRFHDLLRLFARDRAEHEESPRARSAALARLLDFFLSRAAACYAYENPGDRVLDHLAATGERGVCFSGRDEAQEWLYAEADGLLAVVRQAAELAVPQGAHRAGAGTGAARVPAQAGSPAEAPASAPAGKRATAPVSADPGQKRTDIPVSAADSAQKRATLSVSADDPADKRAAVPISAEDPEPERATLPVSADDPAAKRTAAPVSAQDPEPDRATAPISAEHPAPAQDGTQRAPAGTLRAAVDLLFAAQDLMESGSYARQHEEAARALVVAAQAEGAGLVEGRARLLIGHRAVLCGRFEDADREAVRSLALGVAAADPLTASYAANLRGLAATVRNDPARTAEHHRTAIEAFRADRNRRGESAALSNLSRALIELEDVPGAVQTAERALAILRELEGGFRVGNALYALALALNAARRRQEAQARFAEALAIFQDARQRFWEGLTLFRLSELELGAGHPRQSASLAERALAVLHDVNGGVWEAHALTALGRALAAVGQPDRARACWRQALDTYVSLDAPEAGQVRELLDDRSLPPVVAV